MNPLSPARKLFNIYKASEAAKEAAFKNYLAHEDCSFAKEIYDHAEHVRSLAFQAWLETT